MNKENKLIQNKVIDIPKIPHIVKNKLVKTKYKGVILFVHKNLIGN